jgi:hypothetical protein
VGSLTPCRLRKAHHAEAWNRQNEEAGETNEEFQGCGRRTEKDHRTRLSWWRWTRLRALGRTVLEYSWFWVIEIGWHNG